RLKQIDFDGSFEYSDVVEITIGIPDKFVLYQNYPNPFNPVTKIKYSIPNVIASETKQSQLTTIKIYDVLGREVAVLVNEFKPPGVYEVEFDGSNLSSGVYFYTLTSGSFTDTKKLIFIK
ncbi:MAG TPA: T9SS type A sorting domain-containing protein, partial [Ignavibacteriaceae bacterium]